MLLSSVSNRLAQFVVLTFLPVVAAAQVQFTAADNPAVGQSATFTFANPAGFDVGARGTDVTWDFGTLGGTAETIRRVIPRSALTVNLQTAFPTAAFAIVDDTTTYIFGQTSTTLRIIGIATPRTVTNLAEPNNPFETRPVEFTQGRSFNDQFIGQANYPSFVATTRATARTTFDGVGTLILNSSTSPFRNVKRLVTQVSRSDEFTVNQQRTIQQTVSTTYAWYPQRGSLPLVEYNVDTTRILVNGRITGPEIVRVRLLAQLSSVVSAVESDGDNINGINEPRMYRVNDNLDVPEGTTHASLYGIDGSHIATAFIDGSTMTIPHIAPGVYVLRFDGLTTPSARSILIAP